MSRTPRRLPLAGLLARLLPGDLLGDPVPEGAPLTSDARAFESALRAASLALVAEPLPPAARLGVVAPRGTAAPPRRVAAFPLLAGIAAVAVAVSLLQVLPRGSAGGAGSSLPASTPQPLATPQPVATSQGPGPAFSPGAWASSPASATPVPSASPSAACGEAFAVAVKAWTRSGAGQITVASLDKATIVLSTSALGKAFGVCSPEDLRAANALMSIAIPVKVQGASTPRYVTTQLLSDVDAVARVLCRGGNLASTRTCVAELAAPTPASSGSP